MVIRKVGVWSVAKLAGLLYAALGLISGVIVALFAVVGAGMADQSLPMGLSALFGAGAVLMFPILYGLLGAVFGAISAGLYNLSAGVVGGVEIEVQTPGTAG